MPLDIPVDVLVTWEQLIGERRLSDAIAECDARGWNALPLAPTELTRLFPALWATKKAAERWIAKNPPEAIRDIIRVWGVLNADRPQGPNALVTGAGAARGGCAVGDRGGAGGAG